MFISDTLNIDVVHYGPWALFNWMMPVVNVLFVAVGLTLKDLDNKPFRKKAAKV